MTLQVWLTKPPNDPHVLDSKGTLKKMAPADSADPPKCLHGHSPDFAKIAGIHMSIVFLNDQRYSSREFLMKLCRWLT